MHSVRRSSGLSAAAFVRHPNKRRNIHATDP